MDNNFERMYRYSDFTITNHIGEEIHQKINYTNLCKWLSENKYDLFGFYIYRINTGMSWEAEDFIRYETEI